MVNCVISVFYAQVTHICWATVYRLFIESNISLCLERKKNGEVLLVRGVFLFDSLSYGDSAHEGNGVKR